MAKLAEPVFVKEESLSPEELQAMKDSFNKLNPQLTAEPGIFNGRLEFEPHDKIAKLEKDIEELKRFLLAFGVGSPYTLSSNQGLKIGRTETSQKVVKSSTEETYNWQLDVNTQAVDSNFTRDGGVMAFFNTETSGVQNSALTALQAPAITGRTGSITQGGTTLTDSIGGFTTNELAGAIIHLSTPQEAYEVASNTANVITITGGTWQSATASYGYVLARRPFLGSANYPWRRGYLNEIRMGEGSSTGTQNVWIKFGTGSPEGVVTGAGGSIYLRQDGAAATSLYVKSGTFNSAGWTALS